MNLYPFQEQGVQWLLENRGAYLADVMGSGKSVQACAAARKLGDQVYPTLVVGPASTLENWRREWAKWGPGHGATFLSYASRELQDLWLERKYFRLVILDEAHYCKNPEAKRTQAALGLASLAGRAMLLSGTPMPNHPAELWAPINAIWPEHAENLGLPTYDKWFNFFCKWRPVKVGYYKTRKQVFGSKNLEKLSPILQKFMLRRKLDDIGIELPPLRVDVSLLPPDRTFAAELSELGIESYEDLEKASGDHVAKLRRLLGMYKAGMIADQIAEELEAGEYDQIVILAHHRDVLTRLRSRLKDYGEAGFDGSYSQETRQSEIDRFTSGQAKVFIAQQTAAGIGINLQTASEIVLVEPDWSPDNNRQAIKRVHRIGSERPVRARVFAVAGTLDEQIMQAVATKTQMQKEVGL